MEPRTNFLQCGGERCMKGGFRGQDISIRIGVSCPQNFQNFQKRLSLDTIKQAILKESGWLTVDETKGQLLVLKE